ncbi:MAG: hypothetical protein DRG37_04850 [Deltaproteobacteria bacterium]|nr:MAG: hypothetical protein DRG37_04850 [Deltaproteobacteria bacterium]
MAKILIVDDSPTARKLMVHTLRPKGHECIEASDGFDALEKMVLHPDVELIITDLNMPNMDGMELIKEIRKNIEYRDLPIIMLTSENDSQNRRKVMQAGADLYMVKPSPSHIILYKVESLLGADVDK